MRDWLRRLARAVLGDYSVYKLYRMPPQADAATSDVRPVDAATLAGHPAPELRELVEYAGEGARGFGAWTEEGELGAACWFWTGPRLRRRGWGELPPGSTELVQINTAPEFRGRGLAVALIRTGGAAMRAAGCRRVFARVWHSNRASLRAFEKAGWEYDGWFVSVRGRRVWW
jgi:ribosomal protein S18 acetylase RimI-like enzyme